MYAQSQIRINPRHFEKMFCRKAIALFSKLYKCNAQILSERRVQVSVVGAANDIGSNLALLLKQNNKVSRLKLYDDDERVQGVALEISLLPGGPAVYSYCGSANLGESIAHSNLIVMVNREPRSPGVLRDQMLITNAPSVQNLCMAMVERNPGAFLAVSTNPINSIIPFVSAVLYKHNCYNPFKIFGITHIHTVRSKSLAAEALKTNPRHLEIPVIGGHSEHTVVPLFSNISPSFFCIDSYQADMLTRLVKKSGSEVVNKKYGTGSASVAMAWSVNEFVNGMVDAIRGDGVELNCYTANPHFGTRFFAGPNVVGPYGLIQTCSGFQMSNFECTLLAESLRALNKDIALGEDYARTFS